MKQLEAMFDVPAQDVLAHEWHGDVSIEDRPWNVGLIVGPSGCGKSCVANSLFGSICQFDWSASSVIDEIAKDKSIQDVAATCSAVGFNTIPSWMKPYAVLSNGEKFRAEIARHLLQDAEIVVIDEFTSVVDRQVAKIASHAVQKHVRRHDRKFVAVSCHYDIVDWLQPDWVLEPATMTFQWRSLRRRPTLGIEIGRVEYAAWRLFSPFHYLTADLHRSAQCFVAFVDGVAASFAAVLHRPHPRVDDIKGVSRLVTLPDYQGLGLALSLVDHLGAAYKTLGSRLRTYPAHPSLVRSFDRSSAWAMKKRTGIYSSLSYSNWSSGRMGGRPCAVFEYCGPAMPEKRQATLLIGADGN